MSLTVEAYRQIVKEIVDIKRARYGDDSRDEDFCGEDATDMLSETLKVLNKSKGEPRR